jgi:dTMP kinase
VLQRGKFIVLEGADGAGTTTQAELIRSSLAGLGVDSRVTAQPSNGPIGVMLRSVLRGVVVGRLLPFLLRIAVSTSKA